MVSENIAKTAQATPHTLEKHKLVAANSLSLERVAAKKLAFRSDVSNGAALPALPGRQWKDVRALVCGEISSNRLKSSFKS